MAQDLYITRSEYKVDMDEVKGGLQRITDKLDERTRPNLAVLLTLVFTGIGTVGFFVIPLCGAMFYYFNVRLELATEMSKRDWMQNNVRVERVEDDLGDVIKDGFYRHQTALEDNYGKQRTRSSHKTSKTASQEKGLK